MVKVFPIRCLIAAAITAVAGCTGVSFPEPVDAIENAGPPDIDLSQYELTFEDEFRKLDVSGRRCDTKWIAHTPWNGDFGSARFVDPSRNFPFATRQGLLRIEARNDPARGWESGLMAGWNTCDDGFSQQYGYFEIRTMLPAGDGFWPAFWLIGSDRSRFTAEIDVFEHHSARPDRFSSTVHVHPRAEGVKRVNVGKFHEVPAGTLYRGFNTYGVSIDETDIVFYFNRREIWRTPTLDEFRQPLYVLFNLAMEADEVTADTPPQAFMYVDYVRAYARKPASE
ncbi:MAG: glycoside hydrolase family 16 protein [Pseudomonadota bacterium]